MKTNQQALSVKEYSTEMMCGKMCRAMCMPMPKMKKRRQYLL